MSDMDTVTHMCHKLCCTTCCNQLDFKNVLMILAEYIFVVLNLLEKIDSNYCRSWHGIGTQSWI